MVRLVVMLVLGVVLLHDAGAVTDYPTDLKSMHPECFVPGRVSVLTNGNTVFWVYCGVCRRHPMLDAPRLRTVARLKAEAALEKVVRRGRSGSFEISGELQVGKEVRGQEILYVFAAPTGGVAIVEAPVPQEVPPETVPTDAAPTNAVPPAAAVAQPAKTLLELVDAAEREPANVALQLDLAEGYRSACVCDQAEAICLHEQRRMLADASLGEDRLKRGLLMRSSMLLLSLGALRPARDGFRKIRDLQDPEHLSQALKALAEIQISLGINSEFGG